MNLSTVKSIEIPEGIVKRITRNGTVLWEKKTSRLPEGYIETEYTGFSGTQYINIGIAPTSSRSFWLDFLAADDCSTGIASGSTAKTVFDFNRKSSSSWRCYYTKSEGYKSFTAALNTRHTIYIDYCNKLAGLDDSSTSFTNSAYCSTTFCLGAFRESGRYYYYLDGNCYSFRVKENDVLIADFVPCYRESDGRNGFYDIVRDTFYDNERSASVNLVRGPEI